MSDTRVDELRQMTASSRHVAALRLARQLLEQELLLPREAVEVSQAGYLAAMALERYYEARRMAEEEVGWAEAIGEAEVIAVASYHLGCALLYAGDLPGALDRFSVFFEADTPPRPALDYYRGPCRFNAGSALMQQRRYREAIAEFQEARAVFEAAGEVDNVVRALLETAWVKLLDDQPGEAGTALAEAARFLAERPDPYLQSVHLVHQALYHLRTGDLVTALSLCEEVLMPGRPGPRAHQLSEAAWISGECALLLDHLHEAEAFGALAADEAVNAKWPALMNAAGDLRRRIRAAKGKHEGA